MNLKIYSASNLSLHETSISIVSLIRIPCYHKSHETFTNPQESFAYLRVTCKQRLLTLYRRRVHNVDFLSLKWEDV